MLSLGEHKDDLGAPNVGYRLPILAYKIVDYRSFNFFFSMQAPEQQLYRITITLQNQNISSSFPSPTLCLLMSSILFRVDRSAAFHSLRFGATIWDENVAPCDITVVGEARSWKGQSDFLLGQLIVEIGIRWIPIHWVIGHPRVKLLFFFTMLFCCWHSC